MTNPTTSIEDVPLNAFHRLLTLRSGGGSFVDGYVLSIIGVAMLQMTAALQLSSFWQGMIAASALVGIFFGGFLGGWLTDRLPPQAVLRRPQPVRPRFPGAVRGRLGGGAVRPALPDRRGGGHRVPGRHRLAGGVPAEEVSRTAPGHPDHPLVRRRRLRLPGRRPDPAQRRRGRLAPGTGQHRGDRRRAVPATHRPRVAALAAEQGRDADAERVIRQVYGEAFSLENLPEQALERKVTIWHLLYAGYGKRMLFVTLFWTCSVIPVFAVYAFAPRCCWR